MRLLRRNIFLVITLCFFDAASQPGILRLKNRTIRVESNAASFNFTTVAKSEPIDGKVYRIISFNGCLQPSQRNELSKAGIELQHYIPDHSYTATISKPVAGEFLLRQNIRSIFKLQPEDKLSARLRQGRHPVWAMREGGKMDVIVHFNKSLPVVTAKGYLLSKGLDIRDESWSSYGFITLRLQPKEILSIASIPFVEYIEPAAPDPKTLNYLMRGNTRANILNAGTALGGENLRGSGVTIGIGDDGDPSDHVDLRDRVINHAAGPQQVHATHVAGIAAGAGLKDPMFQGVAPEATIIAQFFNGIFLNAAAYIADYRMVVTNNSWGNITGECDLSGVYDTYSKLMDDISLQYPYLLHVFAAGNDGPYTCLGYPKQYHTVVSGHQSAKNVLSVGWAEKNQSVSLSSSIGPTADGRLKPEIVSQGSALRSTAPKDEYFTDWGTSMAAPTVAGGAALLIEKYRQMQGGADPKSGLVKALLMNGARDIENPGPDFKAGYGFLHLVRSLEMLKNNRYVVSAVGNGGTNNHNITIPAGTAELKLMIYWHDPAAAIFAERALVNDLDIELVTPGGNTILPWKLKSDSLSAATPASRAADHENNSEQVTVTSPIAGNYTVRVKGTAVNSGGTQEYFIVYDVVPDSIDLSFPLNGEALVPGEAIVVQWDAWGNSTGSFSLEYSADDGASWNTISNSIPANARQFNWTVPNLATSVARLRLTRQGTTQADESRNIVILGQPSINLAAVQCEDRINLTWAAVPGATDYQLYMKKGIVMQPVATTTATNYVFPGLNADSIYWVSASARINGVAGRRAVAIRHQPNTGSCTGNISDNDLKADTVVSVIAGRKFTSTEIITNQVSIRLRNLDDQPANNYRVTYAVNGGPFVHSPVSTTIPAQGEFVHVIGGFDFSAPGNYDFVVAVTNNNPDPNTSNDTIRFRVRQIDNPPVTLPVTEDFETAPVFDIRHDYTGLPGLPRWDFENSTAAGRLRSFVNTGFSASGNRALTMDAAQFTSGGNTNFLTGTFNLGNYSSIPAILLGLKLEFNYRHHGQTPHANNRVWARAKDTDPWTEVFSFDSLDLRAGEWRTVAVHLSDFAALFPLSSSFQLRFGQHGQFPAGDALTNSGITIDNLELFVTNYDVELISVLSPASQVCGVNNELPVTIRFRDHQGVAACIPVNYRVNNGPIISKCLVSGVSEEYTFLKKLQLGAAGSYILEVWVSHPADSYRSNDTVRLLIQQKPLINRFPYLEGFETSNGNWHPEGHRSSWEWGSPSSFKIRSAANGNKAWKTRLKGQYNEYENSYLYSPCFDISSLAKPHLAFQLAVDMEQCRPFTCDQAWLEYSTDGKTWQKLGAYGQGINWYNNAQRNSWDSAGRTTWHLASIDLPKGLSRLQLRFVLQSDAGITREGIAIDDVAIFDLAGNAVSNWRLFPNPATHVVELLTVHEPGTKVSWTLADVAGRILQRQVFQSGGLLNRQQINISYLPKAVYLLTVADGQQRRSFKLLKQ